MSDRDVLALAVSETRVLLAGDQDFGDLVVRQQRAHRGVVLFRLGDYAEIDVWIARLEHVLQHHQADLNQFIVVTRRQVRVRRVSGG